MTSKKVVTKTEKREKVEQVVDPVVVPEPVAPKAKPEKRQVAKPAPVVIDEHIPAQDAKALQAMLRNLLLNDARARLDAAKGDGNPDAIIACMDEIFKLEEEGKG